MPILPFIGQKAPEMREIFEDLHAHPEIGFEETRTAAIVAARLRDWGFDEVHEGIGVTGVVGILKGKGHGNRSIGLRADMDALPMGEETDLPYASKVPGKMHACGHDGHTTMLLGAAQYLAQSRDFDGRVVFIFQPAEEGLGGARRMLEEGLFERFPCDEIYGMHNAPMQKIGTAMMRKGAQMAGASFFDIRMKGKGSHAAQPHDGIDVVVIGADLIGQLQSIVSRNVDPLKPLVVSCTQFHAGTAYNIVPETAHITGTVRYFDREVMAMVAERMQAICDGVAKGYGIEVALDLRNAFDVLVNDDQLTEDYLAAASDVLGAENVSGEMPKIMGSEDFADMMAQVPGAYINVAHGSVASVHNPKFVLDPETLPIGASIYARIVERRLPLSHEAA